MHGDITYGRLAPIMLLKLLITLRSNAIFIYYQLYKLGTGGHTQKAKPV